MKTNDIIELTIEDVTREGMGIGHFEGIAVFVEDAAPGDTVKCKITKFKKSYAIGKIIKIIKPSKSRISSICKAFPQCGGCSFFHIDYQTELKIKEKWVKDALQRIAKLAIDVLPIIGSPKIHNYRNKSQFPVGLNKDGKTVIGFYERKSHDIVAIDSCLISSTAANEAVKTIKQFIDKNNISVYDEAKKRGLIRNIYVRSLESTNQTLITIVINGDSLPHFQQLIEMLKENVSGFCGLILNINKSDTNLVLGQKYITLFGEDKITEELLGVNFSVSPQSFYQINSIQAKRMYEIVRDFADLNKSETVLDLYCGIGTMTLILAKEAKEAIGIEIVPQAIEDAKKCAKENKIENAEFICADANKAVELLKEKNAKPDTIIVDPPRKGLDAETIDSIIKLSPKKLIYVSCDPATLARDLKILNENFFNVIKCQPLDMFPRTAHVESIALLTKKEG